MSSEPESKGSRELAALSELMSEGLAKPSEAELARGLFQVRARLVTARPPARAMLRWAALAGVLLAGVAFALVQWRTPRARPSALSAPVAVAAIEGGKLLEGGYLSESGHAGVALRFSEGSEFRLLPGARGRLRALNRDGARFALEHGTAKFQITRSRDHEWSVEAGPFLVLVKGTEFSVSWDPQSERFRLELRRGRVVISGPVLGEELALRAGQTLTVNLPAAETLITELRADGPVDAASSAPLAAAPPAVAVAEAASKAKAAASSTTPANAAAAAGERRWGEALARGHWDRILADVERDGVDATLQSASSEELFALADAARYRRRADLARAALLAQRRRFPGSSRALDALFLLGRVEELRASGKSAAITLYDQYLAKAPAGTYAAEALGRKMVLSNELAGSSAARPIASEYLRRFPRGSYAGAARALEGSP